MNAQRFSIKDLNDLLVAVELPALTEAQAKHLITLEPRDRIVEAAKRAPQDQNTRGWLKALFQRAGFIPPIAQRATNNVPVVVRTVQPQTTGRGTFLDGDSSAPSRRVVAVVRPDNQTRKPSAAPVSPAASSENNAAEVGSGGEEMPAKKRNQYHVYAGKSALCFEEDTTRSGEPTVALDAAISLGTRTYDWKNKVRLQLSKRELPIVAAALLGSIDYCSFSAHGENNAKGFSIEVQSKQPSGSTYFVKVWSKDEQTRAVPMDAADAYHVSSLVLSQLGKLYPEQSMQERMILLKRLANIHVPQERKPTPQSNAA